MKKLKNALFRRNAAWAMLLQTAAMAYEHLRLKGLQKHAWTQILVQLNDVL